MPKSERLARMLRIVSLIQNRNGAGLKILARECEVSERTIYRDLQALAAGGMPIFFDPSTGGYRFTEKVFLHPLTFELDEAAALAQCLRPFLASPTPLTADLQRAYEKILASLPGERRKMVSRRQEAVDISLASHPVNVGSDVFSRVEEAINNRNRLKIGYYAKTSETRSERKVDPYLVVFRGSAWYLVAYCHCRGAVRLFRLDRITSLEILRETFAFPANFSANAFFADSWHIEQGEPVRVKLRFMPEAAKWVRDGYYHRTQRITSLADGGIIFEATVTGTWEITRWILSHGPDVEVLEPEELRAEVAALAARTARLYSERNPAACGEMIHALRR